MKTLHTYNVMHGTTILKTVGAEDLTGVSAILSDTPDIFANMTEIVQAQDVVVKDFDNAPVLSVITNSDGPVYVRLKIAQYDIKISPYDAPGRMDWYHAMDWAKKRGMRLFSQEEGMLMYAFRDQINEILKQVGGDPLRNDWYHTATEYNTSRAWVVNFSSGFVGSNLKYNEGYVRAVAAY